MKLSDYSIHAWIQENQIKNEKGEPIDFKDHLFLFDIYRDKSDELVVMKGAQVGMSTCEILRNHHAAKNTKMDIIYTLPTDNDVKVFVGGKVNRIIANNPCMLKDVADKDSIEQKQVGNSMIYFRGTWTKKAAIMVTADRLAHDEIDSSKLDVVSDFQARLQHSKFKQTHVFSHPSVPETGVHAWWMRSDQKHWFIKCPHCSKWQFMSWNTEDESKMSICFKRKEFVCKFCKEVLDKATRVNGQWVAKYPGRKVSGYWVPLLISPWVTAQEIIDKYNDPDSTQEFFYTKVLGLPYADGASKLLRKHFMQNITGEPYAPGREDRVVIGIDTGLKLDYVVGNEKGLFYHGESLDYNELDSLMQRWPRAIAIIDAGGDLIGSRKFYERWRGRVFLCYLAGDRKTKELVKWSTGDENGVVTADRNRLIQLVVDEYREKRIPVYGTEDDWYDYYNDWSNLSRIKVLDPETNQIKGHKWVRSGRDHRALATVFWRVGISRFSQTGSLIAGETKPKPNSYMIEKDTASFNPDEFFDSLEEQEQDWRV